MNGDSDNLARLETEACHGRTGQYVRQRLRVYFIQRTVVGVENFKLKVHFRPNLNLLKAQPAAAAAAAQHGQP